jgi:hypothetical protein
VAHVPRGVSATTKAGWPRCLAFGHLGERRLWLSAVISRQAAKPEDWPLSSFRHYATGVEGRIEIESQWSAMRRDNQLPEYLCYREKAG